VEQLIPGRVVADLGDEDLDPIGFISWVKIWPSICAYWFAKLRASTSSRLNE
jgi:hypothetical protein